MVLKYLYYRILKAADIFSEKAAYMAYIYMSAFLMIVLCILFNFLETFGLPPKGFLLNVMVFIHPVILQLVTFIFILVYTYFIFFRKGTEYYERRFISKKWLNRNIKTWMIIGLPIVFFIIGIISSIIMTQY